MSLARLGLSRDHPTNKSEGKAATKASARSPCTSRRRGSPPGTPRGSNGKGRPGQDDTVQDEKGASHAISTRTLRQMDWARHSPNSRARPLRPQHGGAPRPTGQQGVEQYRQRFLKRCKLGGKADRLVRIVDKYLPDVADENRAHTARFPERCTTSCCAKQEQFAGKSGRERRTPPKARPSSLKHQGGRRPHRRGRGRQKRGSSMQPTAQWCRRGRGKSGSQRTDRRCRVRRKRD